MMVNTAGGVHPSDITNTLHHALDDANLAGETHVVTPHDASLPGSANNCSTTGDAAVSSPVHSKPSASAPHSANCACVTADRRLLRGGRTSMSGYLNQNARMPLL